MLGLRPRDDLDQCDNAAAARHENMRQSDWNAIQSVPLEIPLELSVIDEQGVHALIFPCRRSGNAWVNALTGARVDVRPTHWRLWQEEAKS